VGTVSDSHYFGGFNPDTKRAAYRGRGIKPRNFVQLNFDKQLLLFRNELETAYATAVGKRKESKTELWHSMGIFCPQLKTEMRGSVPNESPSCITVGFNKPTVENWLSLCVGKSPIAQDIALLHQSTQGWWKKGLLETITQV
jgi:hypothetical protein